MKFRYILFILSYFSLYQKAFADRVITFFMHPLPNVQKITRNLAKPGKIARHIIEGLADYQLNAGIFATYGGYLQVSDLNGQVTFPRKHENPLIYLIITNKITPIPMFEYTIHHWELVPGAPTQMFTINRKYDEDADLFYWHIEKAEPPEDNQVPLTSVVIVAKPKYIFVPTGISITSDNPNLILPPIFVRKGVNIIKNAAYILNFRHLFGRLQLMYKKEANRYATHITE